MKSIFESNLKKYRKMYLYEDMNEQQDKREEEELEKVDDTLRKETLKKKKNDLAKVKKQNQQTNGSAL
jgi:hypothetical protein